MLPKENPTLSRKAAATLATTAPGQVWTGLDHGLGSGVLRGGGLVEKA